jgi:3-methyladenine DNA glycosylase Tag
MEKFSTILHRAEERHGGPDGLTEKISQYDYMNSDSEKSDDRWLSEFTKRIFQAGFNWSVVENKWDGFEEAFWGFDISRCAAIDMDDMERLTADTRIVRNAGKIKSVRQNAQMIATMASEKGSADTFIRDWPSSDYVGLLDYLNKHSKLRS